MDIIVLIKLVADVEHIPADAWDLEQGTLRRNRLRMITNPLDDRALAAATNIAHASGGEVIALSMGPRSAEHACRRALTMGADAAFLLSDAAFAGSDTLATAHALSAAIRRIQSDRGLDELCIFAGMQSPDGDTAQVPAEVATLLGLPFIPYATRVTNGGGRLHLSLLRRRGTADISVGRGGFVVTMTARAAAPPFHCSLGMLRRGAEEPVVRWKHTDIGVRAEDVGLEGSATTVEKITNVAHKGGRGRSIVLDESHDAEGEIGELVLAIRDELSSGSAANRAPAESAPRARPESGSSDSRCEIWVVIEFEESMLESGGLELLGEARRLAEEIGCQAVAVLTMTMLAGAGQREEPSEPIRRNLGEHGAHWIRFLVPAEDGVDRANETDPKQPLDHLVDASLIAGAARVLEPRTILIPATLRGRATSAVAAALLRTGLTADCTGLSFERQSDSSAGPPRLLQTRPALGGNILATITTRSAAMGLPEMATVRSGVFPVRHFAGVSPRCDRLAVDIEREKTVPDSGWAQAVRDPMAREPGRPSSAGVDPAAEVVVAVGAGIGDRDQVRAYVEPLLQSIAEAFACVVSLACSRAAVEAGILPYEYQIGQTGKSVRPRLYLAVGISGAIQHRLGMEDSASVIAINPDPDAPIRPLCDWYVQGSFKDVIPTMISKLRSLNRSS